MFLILSQEEDESYSDKSDADFEAALEEAQNMSPPPAKKKSKTKKTKKKKKTKTTSSFPGSEGENDGYEVIILLYIYLGFYDIMKVFFSVCVK